VDLRACDESLEKRWKWGVYLINTIKTSFESLIAEVESLYLALKLNIKNPL
jgi:hypothetical protein